MKRTKRLYPLLATSENLRLAFSKAARGKRDQPEVISFARNFQSNMAKLQDQFLKKEFDIGHYHFFVIRDPKVRKICAASFPERVLHHAIMNLCEDTLEAKHIYDSYACRKGKGNLRAVLRAQQFTRRNSWYLKLDIHKFFDSIDHAVAIRFLEKAFQDADLIALFKKILSTYQSSPGKGIPIGNLFSQHLANYYLCRLDHWLKEVRKIKDYIRYMDDFILFASDKRRLAQELPEIQAFLEKHLCLKLKNSIQLNQVCFGVPFLGYRIFPGHIRLLSASLRRFSRKYREYEERYCTGLWSEGDLARHLQALQAFVGNCDSLGFRKMFIQKFGVLS